MESDHIGVYKKAEQQKLFHSSNFRKKCFASLYLILAGSWWKDGNNKRRGFVFIIKAFFIYPPSLFKIIKKLWTKNPKVKNTLGSSNSDFNKYYKEFDSSLISIIIPAYNAENFLAETIDSVLNQTYANWELIVVNDGSTDNTLKIIKQYCEKDARIKIIDKKNEGVSIARNKGFKNTSGAYLAFLDADDKWHEDNLSEKLKVLQIKTEIGLVHADMQFMSENSDIQKEYFSGKEGNILKSLLLWDGTNIPSPSSILVRRETIQNVGLFDTELSTAADQEFFFRIASRYEVAHIPMVLGFYRFHSSNMHKNIALMERDHHLAYLKAKKNGLFHSYWFQRRCFSNLFLIIAASWWGSNKKRSIIFFIKSFFMYPINIIIIIKKLFLKLNNNKLNSHNFG
jgi:glycosyltransferase involved in cell wall biosynthesis